MEGLWPDEKGKYRGYSSPLIFRIFNYIFTKKKWYEWTTLFKKARMNIINRLSNN